MLSKTHLSLVDLNSTVNLRGPMSPPPVIPKKKNHRFSLNKVPKSQKIMNNINKQIMNQSNTGGVMGDSILKNSKHARQAIKEDDEADSTHSDDTEKLIDSMS